MKKFRTPSAKPGELKAAYGRVDGELAIGYAHGGAGAERADARILSNALEGNAVFGSHSLVEELEHRGYDITTLKFSIQKRTV